MGQREPSPFFRFQAKVNRFLADDFLGGPKVVKAAWVINFQKALTGPFVFGLMAYYGNFSVEAWVYLGLHGGYGLLWLLKDLTFPDSNWQKRVTIGSAFNMVALVLGPYWVLPYLLISGVLGPRPPAPPALIGGCIALFVVGVSLMLGADAQKFFTLRVRRGLITDGFFRYVRHPNYLGEMMLYGSFALLVRHWIPWAILLWVWGQVFLTNMKLKEASMSRYPEWDDYVARSGMLLPRLFGPATPSESREPQAPNASG